MPTRTLTSRLARLLLAALLTTAFIAHAAVQQRFLQVTGTNGETGFGTFSWDDSVVPDGETLTENDVLAISITISGGAFPAPQSFNDADCIYLRAGPTPTFESQLLFTCNNGVENFISFGSVNQSILGNYTGVLTWTIGEPPSPVVQPVPSLSAWMALLLAGLMVLLTAARDRGMRYPARRRSH